MMNFWADKRVVVTGGAGFLGFFVVEKLRERGCEEVFVPRSREYDLREKQQIVRLYKESRPELVIHLQPARHSPCLRHPWHGHSVIAPRELPEQRG